MTKKECRDKAQATLADADCFVVITIGKDGFDVTSSGGTLKLLGMVDVARTGLVKNFCDPS